MRFESGAIRVVVVVLLLLLVVAAVELPFENHRALKDLRSEEPDESEDDALTRMVCVDWMETKS